MVVVADVGGGGGGGGIITSGVVIVITVAVVAVVSVLVFESLPLLISWGTTGGLLGYEAWPWKRASPSRVRIRCCPPRNCDRWLG